jgi:potassium-transporting ATPase KdpC subunit
MRNLTVALRVALVTLVLTGVLYPLLVTGLAQALFPWKANGSIINTGRGQVAGSVLIGQGFSNPAYFQPRPSAAGGGYDATASGGSNLGPTSRKLHDRMQDQLERLRAQNPESDGPAPVELVTASASGLDPHISPSAALWQVPRVARSRNVSPERVKKVLELLVEERSLGFVGEPRVNVLLLNLALDRQFGMPY